LIYLKWRNCFQLFFFAAETRHYLESSDSCGELGCRSKTVGGSLDAENPPIMTTIKVNMPSLFVHLNIEPHHSTHKFPSLKY
jgi:hypothetical protein